MVKAHYFRALFLWRWWTTVKFGVKKVRIAPSATLNGPFKSFSIKKGVKIGSRTRLNTATDSSIAIDERVWISSDVEMETRGNILIGAGTTIQRRATLNGNVTIGKGCIIAPNVFISSGTHPFREYPGKTIREQEEIIIKAEGSLRSLDRPVKVGDDCWLGINVVVCPGINIGEGSVIGANTVVVKDVPAYAVVAGVPGKIVSKRV